MINRLNCVMLVDDNEYDNYFHERVIKKTGKVESIIILESAEEALNYLTNNKIAEKTCPDIIFLDINMPGMNGWEFLHEYKKLNDEKQARMLIIMLTTSTNEEDKEKAKSIKPDVGFLNKPLTVEIFNDILSNNSLIE